MSTNPAPRLFTAWRCGAVILAGTGLGEPAPTGPRKFRDCPQPRCHTTVFGESDPETARRLADHHRRCHAHP